MNKIIFVYVDLQSEPRLVGRLWTRMHKDKETATFEYDKSWLECSDRFPLEPALRLDTAPFHSNSKKPLFGAIGDSAPDRWGRTLMRLAERRRAERENTTPRALLESQFLLLVDDEARQGALRFSDSEGGPFLAPNGAVKIPPLVELPRLLSAAERIADDTEVDEDIRILLTPGSSLGGARPKASIRDRDGFLSIAKFPHKDDGTNQVRWEALALSLAKKAGIVVPENRLETIGGKSVLILRRFDREGRKRIPFLSAMSMLGANDGESRSYLEFVDAITQYGFPKEDLRNLWRRIIFNILISNTDDHLRNHGFLYDENTRGWRLSPAYDLNPVPVDIKPRILTTAINESDGTASLELALEVSDHFRLGQDEAKTIAGEVGTAVSKWRSEATELEIPPKEIERMRTAFDHGDLRKAQAMP